MIRRCCWLRSACALQSHVHTYTHTHIHTHFQSALHSACLCLRFFNLLVLAYQNNYYSKKIHQFSKYAEIAPLLWASRFGLAETWSPFPGMFWSKIILNQKRLSAVSINLCIAAHPLLLCKIYCLVKVVARRSGVSTIDKKLLCLLRSTLVLLFLTLQLAKVGVQKLNWINKDRWPIAMWKANTTWLDSVCLLGVKHNCWEYRKVWNSTTPEDSALRTDQR